MSSCPSFLSVKKVSKVSIFRDHNVTSFGHGTGQNPYQAHTSDIQKAIELLLNNGISPDLVSKIKESCNQNKPANVSIKLIDEFDQIYSDPTSVIASVTTSSKVDRTTEITSSKADRLTSTIASKSRSRCAGDKKISPLVVPAVVKSAEESASQPSVVSSPAICNGCLNQPSVFMPDSAEPVVDKCSILKPADAEIPDGLNVGALCCYTAVVAKEVEVMPEVKESPIVESHVPVWSLYCNNQAVVAGTFGLPWCTNKTPATPMKDFFGSKLFQCDFSCAVCYKLNKPLDYAPRLLINEMIGEFKEVPAFAAH